jgi:hypothetical protein
MNEGARRRFGIALLGGAVLVSAALCARGWPKNREVHYLLGSRARSVIELDAAWSDEATGEDLREASFRYERGRAPRVVVHEPSLADGRYAVAITVVTADESGTRQSTRVVEHVDLAAESVSLDLAPRIARSDAGRSPGRLERGE